MTGSKNIGAALQERDFSFSFSLRTAGGHRQPHSVDGWHSTDGGWRSTDCGWPMTNRSCWLAGALRGFEGLPPPPVHLPPGGGHLAYEE